MRHYPLRPARQFQPRSGPKPPVRLFDRKILDRQLEGRLVGQRHSDGFINATAMCKIAGKQISHYFENAKTEDFVNELSVDLGIPRSGLIVTVRGGIAAEQGTWIHPDMAVHLAQWCSSKFAIAVSRWVREWMISGRSRDQTYHITRYALNNAKIPLRRWSILNETTLLLIAMLQNVGYVVADNHVPDISVGKLFLGWTREQGIDVGPEMTYRHDYGDNRAAVMNARHYPLSLLTDFRTFFYEYWMPRHSVRYFAERDPQALPFLRKIYELPAGKNSTPQELESHIQFQESLAKYARRLTNEIQQNLFT